jgi:hypothetical protein
MKTLEINDKNKKQLSELLKKKTPIIILFYMDGCVHCDALDSKWKEVGGKLEKEQYIHNAQVEYKSIGLLPENIRKNIAGYPTIQIIKEQKVIAEYMGDRSSDSILEFANKYNIPPPPTTVKSKPAVSKSIPTNTQKPKAKANPKKKGT